MSKYQIQTNLTQFGTYYGGKGASGVHQNIINEIRPHNVLFSGFLGHDYIVRSINRSNITVFGCELDRQVVKLWRRARLSNVRVVTADTVRLVPVLVLLFNVLHYLGIRCVWYLDPPYPLESRSYQLHLYKHELTIEDHKKLLRWIKKLKCDVLISTYPNPLYHEYLSDWRLKKFRAKTRKGMRTEFLYMNYENPEGILHDYQYVGVSYRDRERIKRKISRWVNRLNRLPAKEKNSILNQLKN